MTDKAVDRGTQSAPVSQGVDQTLPFFKRLWLNPIIQKNHNAAHNRTVGGYNNIYR
jgi:hypothetical protein